jgi:hypothetical protein
LDVGVRRQRGRASHLGGHPLEEPGLKAQHQQVGRNGGRACIFQSASGSD